MGILYHQARLLCEARAAGMSFARTLTVARLSVYLHPAEVRAIRRLYQQTSGDPANGLLADYRFGEYSDHFLRDLLDIATLDVLDHSAYEGAALLHDLNQPVPQEWWGRYDAVIDGGSLEHVFNFPVAVANLMRLTRIGGGVFLMVPANNLCGHGFYQFSPELMYRVFAPANGFVLKKIVLLKACFPGVELTPIRRAYEVADPAAVRRRVGLVSRHPVVMMVEAHKVADATPFAVAPQQSDYVAAWERAPRPAARVKSVVKRLLARLPLGLRNRLLGYYQRWQFSLSNARFFKKL
jgi:hypothetical protein